ncbi:hypothetical protein D3C86_2250380 [compost metagenome]
MAHHRLTRTHAAIKPQPFIVEGKIERKARRTFGKQRDCHMQLDAALDMML